MIITAPVTDYIPASVLTTLGDLVIRGAAIPERHPALTRIIMCNDAGAQAFPNGADTLIEFPTEVIDRKEEWSQINDRFEPIEDGLYFFAIYFTIVGLADNELVTLNVAATAAPIYWADFSCTNGDNVPCILTGAQEMAGGVDNLEFSIDNACGRGLTGNQWRRYNSIHIWQIP